MGYDALIDSAKLNAEMTATANAIREKTGRTNAISWTDEKGFAEEIESIKTVENLSSFSTIFSGTTFSWLFLDGYTFTEFVNSQFNSYGKVSSTAMASIAELAINGSYVTLKSNTQYVLSTNGSSTSAVKPTDIIEANKQYQVYISYS